MSPLGWFHFATSLVAMASGAFVLLYTRKGTRLHRQAGWVFVASMLTVNITALMIYRLFGGFGPFHVFAIISLASVIMATVAAIGARRSRLRKDLPRRARLVAAHYQAMSYSYLGLMAAFVSEVATRSPATRPGPGRGLVFGLTVGLATMAVFAVGAWLIRRRTAVSLAPFSA